MVTETIDYKELTADDINAADDLTLVPYPVPEWKGKIYFRVLDADTVFNFRKMMKKGGDAKDTALIKMFSASACNSKGELLYPTDVSVKGLFKKSMAVFLRMEKFLLQLNGMTQPDKSWETVKQILMDAGVDAGVIAAVQIKWEADDQRLLDGPKNS
jgi:hypothetical protein